MTEELQKQLVEMLKESMAIAKEQIPDALAQYLNYVYTQNTVLMYSVGAIVAISFVMLLCMLALGCAIASKKDDLESVVAGLCVFFSIVFAISFAVGVFTIPSCLYENYGIRHSPKGYLVSKVIKI